MEPEDKALSQKEYLKKYLSIGVKGGVKKKKKKPKPVAPANVKRSMVIDDDLDLSKIPCGNDDIIDLDFLGDEAPQVVAVIDERPLMDRPQGKMWKTLDGEDDNHTESKTLHGDDSDLEVPRREVKSEPKSDSDASPPRKEKGRSDRNGKGSGSDFDIPVPRKKESDASKRKWSEGGSRGREEESGRRKEMPRERDDLRYQKGRGEEDDKRGKRGDASPPRKSRSDDRDRRKRDSNSLVAHKGKIVGRTSRRNSDSSDLSPPRKSKSDGRYSDSDLSPPRKSPNTRNKRGDSDSDMSPPRKSSNTKSKRGDSDLSPPRKLTSSKSKRPYGGDQKRDSDSSPPRKGTRSDHRRRSPSASVKRGKNESQRRTRERPQSSDSDLSPSRRPKKGRSEGGVRKSTSPNNSRMEKTLDGKKAGLQNAKLLKEELRHLKEKENKIFRAMDAHTSGVNAAPVVRDRKTGRVRDFDQERIEEKKRAAKEAEHQKKYDRWGKGLKQVEDAQSRRADILHEMSKPLARYADDEDLDRRLKEQEREGDPMLDYIRSKQREAIALEGGKPKYEGTFMPNRFGIAPGHRWDGVDRSNGYEKKWFEQQAARKARQEEAYKWSTSDM